MTWQPIETAPRDGTKVLLWCDKDHTVAVGWTVDDGEFAYWDSNSVDGWSYTHWMPLPDPPQKPLTTRPRNASPWLPR